MIIDERKDIHRALMNLSFKQMYLVSEEDKLDPDGHIPDATFLEVMKEEGIDDSELPVVREAFEQMIELLRYTEWNADKAVGLINQAKKSREQLQ